MNIQIIFAVKRRNALLHPSWRSGLFKYISGIVNQRGHYSLAVNGHHDHIHIFLDYHGHELISELVREIKKASNVYINDRKLCPVKFEWQNGYGVFSHGHREKDKIINYVKNQEAHHQKKSFRKEYHAFLKAYEIEFDDKYLFEFFD